MNATEKMAMELPWDVPSINALIAKYSVIQKLLEFRDGEAIAYIKLCRLLHIDPWVDVQ